MTTCSPALESSVSLLNAGIGLCYFPAIPIALLILFRWAYRLPAGTRPDRIAEFLRRRMTAQLTALLVIGSAGFVGFCGAHHWILAAGGHSPCSSPAHVTVLTLMLATSAATATGFLMLAAASLRDYGDTRWD